MPNNAERTRALTTLLRYRGGSITLAIDDAAHAELQRMLQQLVVEGLVERLAPSETTVTYQLCGHHALATSPATEHGLLQRTV